MPQIDRRGLLAAIGALTLPPALARAAAIDADVRAGTIQDVEHVVILMQENRGFDHYFGTLNGVRGFGDRFPVPVRDAAGRKDASVFVQAYDKTKLLAPFPLNSAQTFAHMRVEGTPHSWTDAQDAWDQGRMDRWPDAKHPWSMGYFQRADIPFQYALADAFTLCDAYHCATQTGTNTNRLFLWTGTNDPAGKAGGPSISNSHDNFAEKGGSKESYSWTTYPERLLKAGVSWRIYQDMADNFTDNPLAGFKAYRDAYKGLPGSDQRLKQLALSTWHLDKLREDVVNGRLPQVSWIIAPAADSEHPNPSSPAQGADYTARVIDALTADPKVWARTVFLVMFDENDGFYDHMPPPSPASRGADGKPLLLLSRFGAGRVALLLSDHIWLWARGYEGGGPHLDLLRRMSHWLMQQPDLDEEALRLQIQGKDLAVIRQTMGDTVPPVTVTSPSGTTRELTLSQGDPGEWRATLPASELGLWQATDGTLKALINVGPTNPKEFSEVTSTTETLKPLAQATGGDARRIADGSGLDMPRIVPVRSSTLFSGDGWMGVRMRDASVVKGVGVLPMFAGVIGLLLLLGALAATWVREGR